MKRWLTVWPFVLGVLAAQPRFELQYFHDEDESALELRDLQFPSNQRGIAVGTIEKKRGLQPVCLVTSDGGALWTPVRLKSNPISLFFLNESQGWMVADGSLWATEESGLSWRKVGAPKGLLRVCFLDAVKGFGVGLGKKAWHTQDGGRSWEKIAEADQLKGSPNRVVLGWIEFLDQRRGLVTGWNVPRSADREFPDWMDPESSRSRVQPSLSVTLETSDGGASWTPGEASMFGRVTKMRFGPAGTLGLVEFSNHFDWPSEVYWFQWSSRKNERVYRSREVRVTDLAWTGGTAYLAGVEHRGALTDTPIPSRVRTLRSRNLRDWEEIAADYRAVARRVVLASSPEGRVWMATDTGMILRLADR